ncbi:hypothetical protein BD324DRAFT_123412 [Kockovaella imperatae]|uniref:Uncharacterized protein n=1 Tax=Kockovaella imperatae TaxID=4999 RepID=A0A1Y1U9C2_9TREE|nr:hypothetical protein BD324DRAFT_123412 [Kockovaella imperatae]ORX34628.1 hypothetical protein BD324DRAFT_123412 [Kockovaella imperatae]
MATVMMPPAPLMLERTGSHPSLTNSTSSDEHDRLPSHRGLPRSAHSEALLTPISLHHDPTTELRSSVSDLLCTSPDTESGGLFPVSAKPTDNERGRKGGRLYFSKSYSALRSKSKESKESKASKESEKSSKRNRSLSLVASAQPPKQSSYVPPVPPMPTSLPQARTPQPKSSGAFGSFFRKLTGKSSKSSSVPQRPALKTSVSQPAPSTLPPPESRTVQSATATAFVESPPSPPKNHDPLPLSTTAARRVSSPPISPHGRPSTAPQTIRAVASSASLRTQNKRHSRQLSQGSGKTKSPSRPGTGNRVPPSSASVPMLAHMRSASEMSAKGLQAYRASLLISTQAAERIPLPVSPQRPSFGDILSQQPAVATPISNDDSDGEAIHDNVFTTSPSVNIDVALPPSAKKQSQSFTLASAIAVPPPPRIEKESQEQKEELEEVDSEAEDECQPLPSRSGPRLAPIVIPRRGSSPRDQARELPSAVSTMTTTSSTVESSGGVPITPVSPISYDPVVDSPEQDVNQGKNSKWRRSIMGLGAAPKQIPIKASRRTSKAEPPTSYDSYIAHQKRIASNRQSCQPTLHTASTLAEGIRHMKKEEQDAAETFFM